MNTKGLTGRIFPGLLCFVLSCGTINAQVMTYASDLFSWYAGSVEADVYFCPERQGTYYGGFYMKDAPAIGHEGYSIDEQLTATAGDEFVLSGMYFGIKVVYPRLSDKQKATGYIIMDNGIGLAAYKLE